MKEGKENGKATHAQVKNDCHYSSFEIRLFLTVSICENILKKLIINAADDANVKIKRWFKCLLGICFV